ncbi:MAG: zinc ribbon domain-containing protein [Clostridia bacterium]|nr:zinc ribbon domain-containing protein [Clostridia bacterium]
MYCENCGNQILDETKPCSSCGQMPEKRYETKDFDVCPKCNSILEENSKFCKNCGYATLRGKVNSTRKGIVRIVCGSILLLLTVIAIIGAYTSYTSYMNQYYPYYTFDKFNILDYPMHLTWALCSLLLIFFGKRAHRNGDTATMILHQIKSKHHIICKYIFGSLLTVHLIVIISDFFKYYYTRNIIISILDNPDFVFSIVSLSFLIVYFFFYIGSKLSVLFSNGLLFWGISILSFWLSNIDTIEFYAFNFVPMIISGFIYIILAIVLYRENFSSIYVKLFGCTILLLELFYSIGYMVLSHDIYFDISLILPITIFVYTCVMPMYYGKTAPVKTSVNS